VKTRLQAQTRTGSTAIGHQHNYSGMLSAFSDIIKKDGPAGLYKGSGLSVIRGIFGTASNLTTYSVLRDYLLMNNILPDSSWTDMLCSSTSSLVTVAVMNPVDVVRTRVYNQPTLSPTTFPPTTTSSPTISTTISTTTTNTTTAGYAGQVASKYYYSGGMDALVKIVRYEGVGALYKGFTTNFLRLAPHFTLTFLFLEHMRRMSVRYTNRNYQSDFDEKVKTLYNTYSSTTYDEHALVEVLHNGIPYLSF